MILTHYWMKPIPIRNFDWEASRSGWDLGDPVGFGKTKEEAIADLIIREEEK